MAYSIYIATNENNEYILGKQKGKWGFNSKPNSISLKSGDLVLFVHELKYNGDGDPPEGFPILSTYDDIPIEISEIRRAEIRSELKNQDDSELNFPYTFDVDFKDEVEDISIHELKKEFIETIRLLVTGKNPQKIDTQLFFKYDK